MSDPNSITHADPYGGAGDNFQFQNQPYEVPPSGGAYAGGGDSFQAPPYSLTAPQGPYESATPYGSGGPSFNAYEDIPSFDSPPPPLPTDAELRFDNPEAPAGGTPVQPEAPQESYKFYQIQYYRPYFDVDTKDVGARIVKTFVPLGQNFFEYVNPTPDLYGPFWIASTVVFLLAAAGSVASDNMSIATVSFAAAAIYGYIAVLPILLWAVCKWWMDIKLTLVEHWCIYGYSFSVYIPAAFILIIPWDWLHWLIMALAGGISTLFIVKNYMKPYAPVWKKGIIVIIVQAAAHLALALVFKLKFFHYIGNSSSGSGSSSGSDAGSASGSAGSASGSAADLFL